MVDRITITKPTYMQVEGQWCIVDPGSVVDVLDGSKFHGSNATPVAETVDKIANDTAGQKAKAMPVRNMRRR